MEMNDDIVNRLREQALEGIWDFTNASFDMQSAADEIERLRTLLDNILEREKKDNLRQLEIVHKVEADRDLWRKIADDLYKQVCINFCWHCGHERTREYKADEAVTRYRDAVCDEQR